MSTHVAPNLHGRLVALRSAEPSDAEFMHRLECEPGYHDKAGHLGLPWSMAAVRRDYEERTSKRRDGDGIALVIETTEPVGLIFTHHVNRRVGSFSYGIQIAEGHHRKGHASEAITLLLAYFFDELQYAKANATVFDWNDASIALHESSGFVREGRLRRGTFTRGAFHDEICFGITREEFAQRRAPKPARADVELRRRPDIDQSELQALFASAWPDGPKPGYEKVLEQSLTWIGAYDEGRLVGFVNVDWEGGGNAWLVDTTVHPDWQRRGIGTAVVREALAAASEQPGMQYVHVDYDAELRGFYSGAGFRPVDNAAVFRVSPRGRAS